MAAPMSLRRVALPLLLLGLSACATLKPSSPVWTQDAGSTSLNLEGWESFSVEGWAYLETGETGEKANSQPILVKEWPACEAPWNQMLVAVFDLPPTNRRFQFQLVLNGKERYALSDESFPLRTWTHFAGVWDGKEISYYLDGEKKKHATAEGRITERGGPLHVGVRTNCGSPELQRWHGPLAGIRIYRRALAPAEIQADFRGGPPRVEARKPSPVTAQYGAGVRPGAKVSTRVDPSANKRARVAIMPLKATSGGGDTMADGFTTGLLSLGFEVIERSQLSSVFSELKLDETGAVNSDAIKRIGKLSQADAVLLGSIERTRYQAPDAASYGADGGSGWLTRAVSVRLVDVESGKVLLSSTFTNGDGPQAYVPSSDIPSTITEDIALHLNPPKN
jgi:hypothetical protein